MPITLSPFRYPGGKSQLYEFIKQTLDVNQIHNLYIEPFAGGAGLALKLLFNQDVSNIWLNDYDSSIYSVWYAILHDSDTLISRLKNVSFGTNEQNLEIWQGIKALHLQCKDNPKSMDNAFSTLMLNRMNVSGIISGGPIGGKQQNNYKLNCRFNLTKLIDKIENIALKREQITLTNLDAFNLLDEISNMDDALIFLDPPYFKQGRNLYSSYLTPHQHQTFANKLLNLSNVNWILTYDNDDNIRSYYQNASQQFLYQLNYSAKRVRKQSELMFANNELRLQSVGKLRLFDDGIGLVHDK